MPASPPSHLRHQISLRMSCCPKICNNLCRGKFQWISISTSFARQTVSILHSVLLYHTTLNHYIDIFLIHPLPFSLLHRIQQVPFLPLVHHRADSQAKGLCRSGAHSLVPPATATDALASCNADLSTHIPDDHPICHVCQLSAHVSSLVGRPSQPPNDEHCLAILSSGQCFLLLFSIPSPSLA